MVIALRGIVIVALDPVDDSCPMMTKKLYEYENDSDPVVQVPDQSRVAAIPRYDLAVAELFAPVPPYATPSGFVSVISSHEFLS